MLGVEIARAVILATPGPHDTPWSSIGAGPKALVPVATKPILFHAMEALRQAGVLEAAIVTEHDSAAAFRAAVGDGGDWGMSVTYAETAADSGVHGALGVTRDFIEDEPVVVQRADALLRDRLRDHIVDFARDDLAALELRLARSGGPEGWPTPPGWYLLSPRAISSVLDGPVPGDPLAALESRVDGMHVRDVEGCLACHGTEDALLAANRHALEKLLPDVDGAQLEDCEIQGPVSVHPTAIVRKSLIRGPAIIGPRTRLIESYVGPYTSIGADAQLEGTEIEHSIVMDRAQLLFLGSRLETSIIGRGARIIRRFDMPRAVRLHVGDGAEVALS